MEAGADAIKDLLTRSAWAFLSTVMRFSPALRGRWSAWTMHITAITVFVKSLCSIMSQSASVHPGYSAKWFFASVARS
eukprot:543599-Pyramimonas_sp.AAC.1